MPLSSFQLDKKIQSLKYANLLRHTKALATGVTPILHYQGKDYINFASNDYLGLAQHPAIADAMINYTQKHGVGSGASHLVSGHFAIHDALEEALAKATGYESALLFSSGYMANIGVITALVGKTDDLFQDRLNHASLIDAGRLSKANRFIYEHLDYAQLAQQLTQSQNSQSQKSQTQSQQNQTQAKNQTQTNQLIITDHVFSMDGTLADVAKLHHLAHQYDAAVMIDDAHGFGLYYGQQKNSPLKADIYMATLSKALGCYGAFVAGSKELITYLKSKARSHIFTTALPPALASASLTALNIIANEPIRQQRLKANIALLRSGLLRQGWHLPTFPTDTQAENTAIQPVIIGAEAQTLAIASQLQQAGFWVIAIRPPTVPAGTCRLRITVSASHTSEHIESLLYCMAGLINGNKLESHS